MTSRSSIRIRGTAVLVSGLIALAATVMPVNANRLGPPWMALVTADQTTLYGSPDRADPVGPLPKGAIVVVIGTQNDMTHTPDGWLLSSDIAEAIQPWIAEVSDPSAATYSKPDSQSDILRDANQGDLVRVTGVSPGVDTDTNLWWATTDGYIGLHSIKNTDNPAARQWTLPAADDAPNGWWAIAKPANVHAAPTSDGPIVGEFSGGEHVKSPISGAR